MTAALALDVAVRSIGAALLHSVWQGALIGVVVGLALKALAGGRPSGCYGVACIGLALMVLAWTATAWQTAARLVPDARGGDRARESARALGPGIFDASPA